MSLGAEKPLQSEKETANVEEQNSQEPETADSQDANDLASRVNGLMGLANKRLSERDAAIAERDAAKAELEALRAQLDSLPPEAAPIPSNPRKTPEPESPQAKLESMTWQDLGIDPGAGRVYQDGGPSEPAASWESFGFEDPHAR